MDSVSRRRSNRGEQWFRLGAFNLGVELGQIAIVCLVIPALIGLDWLIAASGGAAIEHVRHAVRAGVPRTEHLQRIEIERQSAIGIAVNEPRTSSQAAGTAVTLPSRVDAVARSTLRPLFGRVR
jgi:hypothetical protein